MNKRLKSFLQVAFSLTLGFFLIWYFYQKLTEDDKANVIQSFEEANYVWIGLSIIVAILSHVFRAYRWKYPLEALDLKIDMPNRFAGVMIGYLANLAFPRLGEVTRCGVLARYKRMPFEKLFGTVVAERVVDFFILIFLVALSVLLQADILLDFLVEKLSPLLEETTNIIALGAVGVLGLIGAFVGWKFLQKSENRIAVKFRGFVVGLLEGVKSLKTMEGKIPYYIYTVLIWASYFFMYQLTFQAFPETQDVPLGGILASFVLGGLSIVAVQGGLGAYPLAIMWILTLYGIDETRGYAFGWIVWTAQTAMIIVLGFLSMIALPFINSKPPAAAAQDAE